MQQSNTRNVQVAIAGGIELGLKETGVRVTIPNHPKAKLMYYLDCMCNVLELDENVTIQHLRRYNDYNLSRGETDRLLVLCLLLSLDVLLNKCIFHHAG